jgi:hypothetical protein
MTDRFTVSMDLYNQERSIRLPRERCVRDLMVERGSCMINVTGSGGCGARCPRKVYVGM